MIRPIVHDPLFLAQKSEPAVEADRPVIADLQETLRANLDRCVGMAANMIGVRKRIIVFTSGPMLMVMVNPRITDRTGVICLKARGIRLARITAIIPVSYRLLSRSPSEATSMIS